MPDANMPPVFVTDDEFRTYTKTWQQRVMQAIDNADLLNAVFADSQSNRTLYFAIPASWLRSLIATVGCTQVKARFMVNDSDLFAIAFYATDDNDKRLSAYYRVDAGTTGLSNSLSAMYGSRSNNAGTVSNDGDGGSEVPHDVAADWIKAWKDAATITYTMFFSSHYGALQGYNFSRGDLVDNLYNDKSQNYQQLRIDFSLHSYYGHDGDASSPLSNTFGLVLRLVNPDNATSSTPFYDLATPCPPTY